MKVCFVISECVPYVKTGGLADVGGALPKALADAGCEVKIFLPLYGSIDRQRNGLTKVRRLKNVSIPIGDKIFTASGYRATLPDSPLDVLFIDCPKLYHRPQIYTTDPDEDERFILFQLATVEFLIRLNWAPDVVHCNDWQTGLLPVYLKEKYGDVDLFEETVSMLSIHNIAYQGRFARESVFKAGLPYDHYYPGGPFEIDDSFCFLKTGIWFADVITTVSETYAREIRTHEYGAGLDGVLDRRRDDLYGILNGIDTSIWNPSDDKYLSSMFSIGELEGKSKNKEALIRRVELPWDEKLATIGMVSRLASQKGFDLLEPIVADLMKLPLQLVVLGEGDGKYGKFLRDCAVRFPHKFSATIGFDDELAHLITGGSDMFLMPSSYEPCGLNQMYSLNYGTVPIVRRTGGLADTVKDYHEYYQKGNGFTFNDYTPEALYLTVRRALDIFSENDVWRKIVERGMQQDFSWNASAKRYLELYKQARVGASSNLTRN